MADTTPNFPKLEEEVLASWKEHGTFERIQNERRSAERFVFWEGPPYANGKPGIHHVLARAYKDAVARYQTMRGKFVDRKAGWDTHGLPTELDVEKKLGVKTKRDIEEKIGIEKFVEECRRTAFGHVEEWRKLTERMAYWVDLEHPYITYTNDYIESVWWVLSQAWNKKLLEQDFKVVPWCTRCGTALSSHELAQGYAKVKDKSVYLKFELVDEPGTFVLAWTTTPWTLPGNVALAVSKKISYVKSTQTNGEKLIVAEAQASVVAQNQVSSEKVSGSSLIGKYYKPLFNFLDLGKESKKKAYYIADADFVSTEEGTGVVHTAVMYGEDDFNLGKKLGLPMVHTVGLDGKFNKLVKPWEGMYVKDPKTEALIIDQLKQSGKLYGEPVKVEHEYPFCWRCGTPVLYYAKTTWFIRMSKLRKELLAANETINWVPGYIKDGRFGEWLREVKDWAVARDRYWGVPLPIWTCDHCGEHEFVGDYETLRDKLPARNRFIIVRHGESKNNVEGVLNTLLENRGTSPLTDAGSKQAAEVAKKLKKETVTAVYSSQFLRARQTADAIAKEAGVSVIEDARINEFNIGPQYEGKPLEEFHAIFTTAERAKRFAFAPEGGESWRHVWSRMFSFLKEIDSKHEGETIVVATHGDPAIVAIWATLLQPESWIDKLEYPKQAKPYEIKFVPTLYRADGTFDPHRPYLDGITWKCSKCATGTMHRTPEVADVWLDSGSMPFAQWHYPFDGTEKVDGHEAFPADFISEGIDQTRGWFYVLLAVSVLTGRAAPYKNVVSLGLVNDAEGRKMSKSVGNVIDPWDQIEKYGVDAVRWFLYTASAAGDFKNYDERGVAEGLRKVFLILSNTVSFWETYGVEGEPTSSGKAGALLDRWMQSRSAHTVVEMTDRLDRFDVTGAGRSLAALVTDVSTWFLRRSRDRFKNEEAAAASRMLHATLTTAVRLLAPFAPLTADAFWARLHRLPVYEVGTKSVHSEIWPAMESVDETVLSEMDAVRRIAEIGHALRRTGNFKVRQPLGQLVVSGTKLSDGAQEILQDELNVQEVVVGTVPKTSDWQRSEAGNLVVGLDTTVTDELRELGMVRETIRAINQLRKVSGLTPEARPSLTAASTSEMLRRFVDLYRPQLVSGGRLRELTVGKTGTAERDEERLDLADGVLELKLGE